MGGARGTDARSVQSIPLASCFENEEDGIHRASVVNAFSVASQRVMRDMLRQ